MPNLNLLGLGVGSVSGVISSGVHRIARFDARNTSATAAFFQIFDSAAAPQPGAFPIGECDVPAGSSTVPGGDTREFDPDFLTTANGIAYGWSSTQATYTPVGIATGLSWEVYGA